MTHSPNVRTVLDILKNEVDGDVSAALAKMADDYSMTWMNTGKDGPFPSTGKAVQDEMEEVYVIKGRKYDIRNIVEAGDVVMIEMVESYPDPKTGKVYKTPQVIVLEFKDGKIRTGRHYNDPAVSHLDLSDEQVNAGLRDTTTKFVID